jgi:hypothetical protein
VSGNIKRGRKRLETDNALLFDAFGDMESGAFSKLRLYVDQESEKVKLFASKDKYPYELGLQTKELEIIFNDISKGDEDGNNSRDLFSKPFENFNKEHEDFFDPENE